MIELQKWEEGGHKHYALLLDGLVVSTAKWQRVGDSAVLHNDVFKFNRLTYRLLLAAFDIMMADMRAGGCVTAVVMDKSRNVDALRRKYWERMGFDVSGTVQDMDFMIRGL